MTVGILMEHEPVTPFEDSDSPKKMTYTPSPEEQKLLKKLEYMFDKAKKHRRQHDEHWMDYYKYFRGRQWAEPRPTYRHAEVINFVFQTIESMVPILSDARQRIEFVAREPSDMEFAKILDSVAEADWNDGNWSQSLVEMLYDGHIYGTGIGELYWDDEAKYGEGDIKFCSKELFYCFPDPNSEDVNKKGSYFIYAEPMDIDVLKRKYPDKAKYIHQDLEDFIRGRKQEIDTPRFKSPVDNKTILEGTYPDEENLKNVALTFTCFWRSDEIEELEQSEVDPRTGVASTVYTLKKKYPRGRKVVWTNNVILEDTDGPVEGGDFPFFKFTNYIDPRVFWGISEVEQIRGPQNIFNRVYNFVLDVLTLMGNPIWLVPTTANIDTDNIFNRPGLIMEFDGPQAPMRQEGTQLQPYVLQILDRVKEYIDNVSGSNDVTRGIRPEGITAASAIQSLQEAAQTRIRQKSRNLDVTLQNFGQLYKEFVFEHYSAPRVFRLTNDKGAEQYFRFHIEKRAQEDGSYQKVGIRRDFLETPEGLKESLEAREFIIRGEFDVKVTTGSSLPFAKDAKFARARQMFLDGVIDSEEYLKQAEYPNYQVVMQRMQEKQAQMAQAQAMQGAPQGPAPTMPG